MISNQLSPPREQPRTVETSQVASLSALSMFPLSVVLLMLCIFPAEAQAQPPVTWSQADLDAVVPQGGITELQVSLNAVETLGDVYLRIVPELDAYIDVEPASLADVRAGDIIPIRVRIQVDSTAPLGLFDGTIQVREQVTRGVRGARQGNGRVFPRLLPVTLLIQEAETIAGVDSDVNGVWDYIDAYIDSIYTLPPDDLIRPALRQYARALEGGLLNADASDMALRYAIASDRATECVFYLRPDDANRVLSDLEAVILNTETRSRAFLMFSEQSAGQVFSSVPFSERATSCVTE